MDTPCEAATFRDRLGHMNIKLLALDLDDTLLTTELTISPANIAAVRAAAAAGCRVVLASGRSLGGMRGHATTLGLVGEDDFIISQNGAEITSRGGTVTHKRLLLDRDQVAEVYEWTRKRGLSMHRTDGTTIFASEDNSWSREDSRFTGMPLKIVDESGFVDGEIPKVVVNGDAEVLAKEEVEARRIWGDKIYCYRSKPFFMEILPIGADKGHALEEVAGLLGVPQDQVAAIGDSWNDVGMISWAGTGIAIANAVPEVRAVAKYATRRNHDKDGVAEAIHEILKFGIVTSKA